jgi:hypothetical protein
MTKEGYWQRLKQMNVSNNLIMKLDKGIEQKQRLDRTLLIQEQGGMKLIGEPNPETVEMMMKTKH